jgi:MFS family permease
MRRLDSPVRLMLFGGGVFALESGFFAVVPPLVPRLVHDLHLSTTEVGVLVAAYPAGVLFGAIPSIALVNRRGVRVTAFAGLGLLVLATLGFALGGNGIVLDCARFVQGLGGSLAWAGALAWLMSTTAPVRRGAVIGGAVGSALIGTVFGPAVGALAAEAGRGPVFGALAVLLGLLALAAPAVAPSSGHARGSVRALFRLLRNRSAATGNVSLFVIGVSGGTMLSLTPLLIARLGGSAATIAWMVALGYLLAALFNVVLGPLSDRIGRVVPIVSLLVVAAVLLPWLPVFDSLAPLLITAVLAGAVLTGLWTPTAAMVADGSDAGPSGQAVAVAAMNAAWAAGGAAGPVVMASIADNAGFVVPFVACGALCGLTALAAAVSAFRRSASEPAVPALEVEIRRD